MEHFSPVVHLFGVEWLKLDLANALGMVLSALLVFLIIWLGTRRMTAGVPRGWQNFMEWVIDFVRGIAGQFMDAATAARYVTLALTLFLYIFVANQIGLLFTSFAVEYHEPAPAIGITEEELKEHGGKIHVGWWKSPTSTVSVTFTLALIVLLYSHYLGIKKSPKKYFKHYFEPNPALLPLNLIEEGSKFLTLPLRLFGNIFAGEVLVLFLAGGAYLVTALPFGIWLGYSVFVGAIQAYIFTTLSMVYISQKIGTGH